MSDRESCERWATREVLPTAYEVVFGKRRNTMYAYQIFDWNDHLGRTELEVLDVLNRAIEQTERDCVAAVGGEW